MIFPDATAWLSVEEQLEPALLAGHPIHREGSTRKEFLEMVEVKVDFARCDANGTCAALMPDVFRIGENGLLEQVATEVEAGRADELEEVVLCCPLGAISRS